MKQEIKQVLRKFGWEVKRIQKSQLCSDNYYSCPFIEYSIFTVNGRIDGEEKSLTMCCEPIEDIPRVSLVGTPEEILEKYIGMRTLLVQEGGGGGGFFSSGCKKCSEYQKSSWNGSDGLIHYVNLSMYSAPCQGRCIYCEFKSSGCCEVSSLSETVRTGYEKLFSTLELAERAGLIAPDATWQVSSGEITIHPYRERILKLVENKQTIFFTNCFKYDKDIAQNLNKNTRSSINLSIDAGTAETWNKVKGVNNFDCVLSNLKKYQQASTSGGQITLKYIILPEINDSIDDYQGLMEIMRMLHVKELAFSRDVRVKYSACGSICDKLIDAAARLIAICNKNDIGHRFINFAPDEIAAAEELAQKDRDRI